jgi:hypothetical protein
MGPKLLVLVTLAGCGACKRADEAAPGSSAAPDRGVGEREPVKRGPPLAEAEFFRIDAEPVASCKSGETCETVLVLSALGDYKVNDEYPFKFVADQGDLVVDGTGTFALDGKKTGTMRVKFRAPKPGAAKLTGTFKLSVCNDANCKIESPKIALAVTAS